MNINDNPSWRVIDTGGSRSFPSSHRFLSDVSTEQNADVIIIIGKDVAPALAQIKPSDPVSAVVVELVDECLGVYTGEHRGEEGSNVLGFNRFRMGDDPPSNLIELVRQPQSDAQAITAASAVFNAADLEVSVCQDQSGRILDRLLRPYFNDVLRRLDDGLASADDMDLTLKLGLGYPEGPVTLLERSGLHHHADTSQRLFEATGDRAFTPARRSQVARQRVTKKTENS